MIATLYAPKVCQTEKGTIKVLTSHWTSIVVRFYECYESCEVSDH